MSPFQRGIDLWRISDVEFLRLTNRLREDSETELLDEQEGELTFTWEEETGSGD